MKAGTWRGRYALPKAFIASALRARNDRVGRPEMVNTEMPQQPLKSIVYCVSECHPYLTWQATREPVGLGTRGGSSLEQRSMRSGQRV